MEIRRCLIVRRLGREDEPIDYSDVIADEEFKAEEMKEPDWSEFREKILKSFPDDYEKFSLLVQQCTTDETGYNWDPDTTQEWSCQMKDIVEGSGSSEERTRFFLDMDGTLAKWQPVDSEEELLEEGFYRNLKPNWDMVHEAQSLISEGFDVYILSCVLPQSQYAEQEKRKWLKQYIPELPKEKYIFVPYGENKADYLKQNYSPITKNDYLVDDYTKNLLEWKEYGGTGVKYLNGINDTIGTWQGLRVSHDEDYRLCDFTAKNGLFINDYGELVRCTEPNIKSLDIPDYITEIKDYAFYGHDSLESVKIPDSVKKIGDYAFDCCRSLRSVEIPDSVEDIGDHAFVDCQSLEKVEIPNLITKIGCSMFAYCTSLENVTIPSSVTKIGDKAFLGCEKLESVEIPDSVTDIGFHAFGHCPLKSISIPDSVVRIGSSAFAYCTSLESVTIPENVRVIGDGAFWNCIQLENVTIPNSVWKIDDYAFANCKNLTNVRISEKLAQNIDFESVFEGTPFLEEWRSQQAITFDDNQGGGRGRK